VALHKHFLVVALLRTQFPVVVPSSAHSPVVLLLRMQILVVALRKQFPVVVLLRTQFLVVVLLHVQIPAVVQIPLVVLHTPLRVEQLAFALMKMLPGVPHMSVTLRSRLTVEILLQLEDFLELVVLQSQIGT